MERKFDMIKCEKCNSNNIKHHTVKGRGLPPNDYKHTLKRISWLGTYNVFTCVDCGYNVKNLIK